MEQLTKRELIAAMAMQALIPIHIRGNNLFEKQISKEAIIIADELIKQLKEEKHD